MNPIVCLGVDPAPSWGGAVAECVYDDNGFRDFKIPEEKAHGELRTRFDKLKNPSSGKHAIVGWDAPLTGPPDPDDKDTSLCDKQLSYRGIEKALSPLIGKKEKQVKGVSVLPFGGCSHWTITRNLVGLPRVGEWDRAEEELPFRLLTEDTQPSEKELSEKPCIVEVHPAVALWLWASWDNLNQWRGSTDFIYKGRIKKQEGEKETTKVNLKERRGKILDLVFERWKNYPDSSQFMEQLNIRKYRTEIIETGDSLDAFIAMALVCLFVKKTTQPDQRRVKLFGDRERGAMLLPDHKEIPAELRHAR